MIKIILPPNEKKPTFPYLPALFKPPENTENEVVTLTGHMWAKQAETRQAIIDNLVAKCKYKVGDMVKCHTIEEEHLTGKEIVVEKIVTSYGQIKFEQWPDSNVPKIVTAYSRDKDKRFLCTPAYLIPLDSVQG